MDWPKPIEHEKWCPINKGLKFACACEAGRINDMLEECKAAYEKEPKHPLPTEEELLKVIEDNNGTFLEHRKKLVHDLLALLEVKKGHQNVG